MEKVFQKLDFSKNMYAIAMAYLEKHLKRLKTEGKGDCWLLSIMAGFEVTDSELVAGLDAEQRTEICTNKRRLIVSWAGHSDYNRGGFRLLNSMCGVSIDDADDKSFEKAVKALEKKLKQGPGDHAHPPPSTRPSTPCLQLGLQARARDGRAGGRGVGTRAPGLGNGRGDLPTPALGGTPPTHIGAGRRSSRRTPSNTAIFTVLGRAPQAVSFTG